MEEVINLLNKQFNPISIFLYGSRARNDFTEKSDFEIGVLFSKDNCVRRSEIKKVISKEGFNIYPFEYEEFLYGKIDTPFQKKIYLRELILAGKTLSGEKVIEKMKAPQINIIDLIQDLRFNLGYAFASMHSNRNGDKKTASYEFYKSCLFATRDLEILQLRVFPIGFENVLNSSRKLNIGEYQKLVEKAFNVRKGEQEYEEQDIFKNISYLNEFIEPILLNFFEKSKNEILVK
ncbi:MAG: nucleotidyltransferase domain-containing protein [Candidatus Aenigmarchaeota archaeon]|nr:nucleotidyltransferase domain-containing protein [Candidatus Aenigmarchaeota archaeon]